MKYMKYNLESEDQKKAYLTQRREAAKFPLPGFTDFYLSRKPERSKKGVWFFGDIYRDKKEKLIL